MIKLILCMILTASGYLIFQELHRKKESLASLTYDLADCFSALITRISFGCEDVFSAVNAALGEKFSEFTLSGGDFPTLWETACRKTFNDPETLRLCLSAGGILGTSDADSQSERLKIIRDGIIKRADVLKEKSDGSKKLYVTLGAALGLAVSIMVI